MMLTVLFHFPGPLGLDEVEMVGIGQGRKTQIQLAQRFRRPVLQSPTGDRPEPRAKGPSDAGRGRRLFLRAPVIIPEGNACGGWPGESFRCFAGSLERPRNRFFSSSLEEIGG
jgi:hypothetical protein